MRLQELGRRGVAFVVKGGVSVALCVSAVGSVAATGHGCDGRMNNMMGVEVMSCVMSRQLRWCRSNAWSEHA